jgi:DNA (cytosine-5)-methyltransferase 1
LMPDLSIVTPALADAERMQGFPAGWTDVAHVLPKFGSGPFNRRKRWQLIGNAVNVEASAWIGEQLAGAAPYDGENGRPLRVGEPWPAAAWYDGQTRRIATHGLWPARRRRQSLAGFLLHGGAPLSRRATAGFLARITTSRLRFKAGFREAVERHLRRMEQNAVVLAIGSTHHAGLTDRGESSRWPDRCSIRMPQHPNG